MLGWSAGWYAGAFSDQYSLCSLWGRTLLPPWAQRQTSADAECSPSRFQWWSAYARPCNNKDLDRQWCAAPWTIKTACSFRASDSLPPTQPSIHTHMHTLTHIPQHTHPQAHTHTYTDSSTNPHTHHKHTHTHSHTYTHIYKTHTHIYKKPTHPHILSINTSVHTL